MKIKWGKGLDIPKYSLPLHPQSEMKALVKNAEVAQLVEHNLAKVRVAGSNPVFRSYLLIAEVIETDFLRK